jgi:hypothetical protein
MISFRFSRLTALALLVLALPPGLARAATAPYPLAQGEAVVTCFSDIADPAHPLNSPVLLTSTPVVAVVDVRDPLAYGAQHGVNWAAPMFHSFNSDWTAKNLGQVFGITLDDAVPPNIYVAASSVYGIWFNSTGGFANGMYGPLGPGGIYQIDGTTGQVCTYAKLPNSGPGLGNITFDRVHQQFFVSDLENGLIYRISRPATKTCASLVPAANSFDHGLNRHISSSALPPLADDGLLLNPQNPNGQSGFTQRGRRIWGLRVLDSRLYYSVWNTDERGPVAGESSHNEIWSVGLTTGGDFDANSVRLEQTLPFLTNRNYSNPVSDIAFSSKNHMLLAERVRNLDYGILLGAGPLDAHRARNLDYDLSAPSGAPPRVLYVGDWNTPSFSSDPHANSAGGVDYGYGYANGTATCDNTIWSTGDALHFPGHGPHAPGNPDTDFIYGLQGSPASGNAPNIPLVAGSVGVSSFFINLPLGVGNPASANSKTKIGDVVVDRQCDCMALSSENVKCDPKVPGTFDYTFNITNYSNLTAQYVYIVSETPGVNVSTHIVPLGNQPIGPGQTATGIQIKITGATSGQKVCLRISLQTKDHKLCCSRQVCMIMPDCCLDFIREPLLSCLSPTMAQIGFGFQNLAPWGQTGHLFLSPTSPLDSQGQPLASANPDYFPLSLPYGGLYSNSSTISGNFAPGTQVCLDFTIHNPTLELCCSRSFCFFWRCGVTPAP